MEISFFDFHGLLHVCRLKILTQMASELRDWNYIEYNPSDYL